MISAHTCALLSEICYDDEPAGRLSEIGFHLVAAYDVGGTQAILVADHVFDADDTTHVLAFPGTADAEDWRTDSRYIKTDFPGGGRVHRGFSEAFDQVRDAIAVDLARLSGRKVFTGHSLGGALTVMAAVEWNPDVAHVFGCPRVGNSAFVKRLRCRLFRFENWFDPVTYVPWGTSPVQAAHAIANGRAPTFYRHAGIKVGTPGFGHPIARYVKATRGLRVPGP